MRKADKIFKSNAEKVKTKNFGGRMNSKRMCTKVENGRG